jgi:hypothetical protein
MEDKNNGFLKRADAHIALANEQMVDGLKAGDISASFMYGAARFNAWIAASSFETREDMIEEKEKAIEYFLGEYKKALTEHIDHHAEHYDFTQNKFD